MVEVNRLVAVIKKTMTTSGVDLDTIPLAGEVQVISTVLWDVLPSGLIEQKCGASPDSPRGVVKGEKVGQGSWTTMCKMVPFHLRYTLDDDKCTGSSADGRKNRNKRVERHFQWQSRLGLMIESAEDSSDDAQATKPQETAGHLPFPLEEGLFVSIGESLARD